MVYNALLNLIHSDNYGRITFYIYKPHLIKSRSCVTKLQRQHKVELKERMLGTNNDLHKKMFHKDFLLNIFKYKNEICW